MLKVIKNLYLDHKGRVRNEDGVVLPTNITKLGVFITINKTPYSLGIVKLLLWYKPKYPEYVINQIVVMYIDGDIGNHDINNLTYRFAVPVESRTMLGFYYIPGYSQYLLSTTAVLYNIIRNSFHKNTLWKTDTLNKKNIVGGYLITRLKPDRSVSRSIGVHRLLGLTFLKYGANVSRLVINHIDGDASNNDITNLEFVTRAENNQHAIDTGLCPNSVVAVTIKNVVTDVIHEFNSISDCAKFLTLPRSTVYNRVRKQLKVYADNYVYRINDGVLWSDIILPTRSSFIKREIIAIDVLNGSTIIADSLMRMRSITGVNTTTMTDSCKYLRETPMKGYIFRYYDRHKQI